VKSWWLPLTLNLIALDVFKKASRRSIIVILFGKKLKEEGCKLHKKDLNP
jgi:hypothetical protein